MRARIQTAALAALFTLPALAQGQVIAITGGAVHPVSGPKIERGTVIIRDGKIAEVGTNIAIPVGARVIDATGKIVTPGLINANTQLGLSEAGGPQFSGGYNDTRAKGTRGVAAAFRAWEGFNPASTFITPARQGGVTTVMIAPNGGMIGGQSALLNLGGDRLDDMLVQRLKGGPAVAMSASFSPGAADAGSRGELLGRLREVLQDAKAYGANRAAFERNATRGFAAPRADLEALQPVVDTTLPLMVEVDRASDIRAVLDLKRRDKLPLRLILLGVAEGWQVAADIAAAKVPVMVGAMSNIPGSFDQLGARQENAALLRAAGIPVVLISNGSDDAQNFNVQNIRHEAGNAVAYGMAWDDALRAITLAPAETFGVADRIGSLRPGRDANIVVWDGDPFEFATKAETVLIRGAVQTGASRQDELTRRYAPVKGRP